MLVEGRDVRGDVTMTDLQQQALDSFYALDNVITVKITMPQADWDAVRNEEPDGGRCNFEWTGGGRFTWRKATSVEISGTKFPKKATFTDVGVKKKSFCGSIDSDKPCLHIDFGKFGDANVPAIEALIGSRYVTLNNSIQDKSYIKQTLGYRLLDMAGLPNSRCNYERHTDRPRGRRRQQPRYLRQCRTGDEALHRAQLQRQHEGESLRA
jgi:hypothetical protein